MSFLNPVNEPVKRFSSTDAGAPQINYNARVAGDVKAVLKACLVTGYGAKASAGWTAVNEVGNVAEFVSPSAAMSDYRLGIDDTSAADTTWYYKYQDTQVNPEYNKTDKAMSFIDKVSANNGWELLITGQGILLIEVMQLQTDIGRVGRLTYFGRVKSMINNTAKNIAFWSVGWHGISSDPTYFFSDPAYARTHFKLEDLTAFDFSLVDGARQGLRSQGIDLNVDIYSQLFITSSKSVVAQQPAILVKTPANTNNLFAVGDVTVGAQQCLSVFTSYQFNDSASRISTGVTFVVPLDYWEY